ncbi:MAG TPA: endosialidase [Lachnospiraceae bacterium]|nr:endosialidase [Lachnospiraceae bacterium]HPF29326.1 endosialidase [Lachnospiraceae bacterium]
MAVVKELLRAESDGSISFGDYTLTEKSKLEDFEHDGDLLKVKTFQEITRLEKNGLFLYESVPGTSVNAFRETADGITFMVEGKEDAQITVGLAEDSEYEVVVNGADAGNMKTNLGGKLSLSVELAGEGEVKVEIKK